MYQSITRNAQGKRLMMFRTVAAAALVLFTACSDAGRLEQQQATLDSVAGISSPAAGGPADTAAWTPSHEEAAAVRDALDALVRGPTAEERAAGAESWFSEETAGVVRSVDVDTTGHAIVDFDDLRRVIPNASSSAGSAMLLDELNATMFGFPGIRSVEYRMEGSCDLFWDWLQYGCQIVDRTGS